jgi:hypothetical protein
MITRRTFTAAAAASLVAAATIAITSWISADAAPNEIRLHLGTDSTRFVYGSTVQNITVSKNSCTINSAEPLIDLASSPNRSEPGFANYGLGVKASPSSGNGSPCAQVDAAEVLTLRPGTQLTNRTFESVRLDLEMTGNAIVAVTLSRGSTAHTYHLQTGNSIQAEQTTEADYDMSPPYTVSSTDADDVDACASPNSSGPNSGGNDNCQWLITPSFNFDTIALTASIGTVTLEGGGDFGNDPAFDTLFTLSNAAPAAVDDTVTTPEDTPVAFNVLTNDTDGDGDALTVSDFTSPTHGSLVAGATPGSFTYTPSLNYFGPDSFTYTASDGTDSSSANVTIGVNAVNDPPIAVDSSTTTPEETAVTIEVGTDVDSTVLTASCTPVPPVGAVTDNGDGTITYTPPLDFTGAVTITCTVTDDQGATSQSTATVDVSVTPVNDTPVAVADTADVDQNWSDLATKQSVLVPVLANDTDVDGDVLVVGSISAPPAHGSAVIEGDAIRYTPADDFVGTDTFGYRASDGQATSNAATVTVTVHQTMCSEDSVSDTDGDVNATFFRLTDSQSCKRYTLEADAAASSVLFQPVAVAGEPDVDYRGVISFGPEAAPTPESGGTLTLLLEYDPELDDTFKPVQWCNDPIFDTNGQVTSADLPAGETWCVASESTIGQGTSTVVTTWQVFGHDDPKFQ